MTLAERHDFIMDLLQQQGSVSVAALAERLKVSEVTVRKDLTLLEEKKMLYRAHGSAILINPYINDRPVNEKEKHNAAEKRAIGIRAASLVTPDDSILIASGTTMLFLAREIKAQGRLTVITSAINVVPILTRDQNVDVVQLGGMVRNTSVSAVGVYAERMLQDFSCSKLYLGVDGIDFEYGLSTTNLMERHDPHRAEDDRAGRQFEIRPSRFQQNLRSGRCRPDHHRQQHFAPHPRSASQSGNRSDRGGGELRNTGHPPA